LETASKVPMPGLPGPGRVISKKCKTFAKVSVDKTLNPKP
jgi:hypothetical protein